MLIQVKGNYETVGVSAEVEVGDCDAQQVHEKTNTKYGKTNKKTNTVISNTNICLFQICF